MAKFDLNDSGVVVIVGSGAGGGTLGNELAQKGVKVVILEPDRASRCRTSSTMNGRALPSSPGPTCAPHPKLARRQGFRQPAGWIVKAVGGSTTHWAGASLRFDEHEFKAKSTHGNIPAPICWTGRSRSPRWSRGTPRPRTRWASPAPTALRGCPATTISR